MQGEGDRSKGRASPGVGVGGRGVCSYYREVAGAVSLRPGAGGREAGAAGWAAGRGQGAGGASTGPWEGGWVVDQWVCS